MEAAYAGERRALHQDDMDGITALYPDPDFVPPPDPDPTPSGDITVTSPNGAAGYWTEGGRSSDRHLNIDVTVEDGGGALSGATVSIDLYRDGVFIGRGSATTGGGGTVTFTLKNAGSGRYHTDVTGVQADGLTFDGTEPDNSYDKPSGSTCTVSWRRPGRSLQRQRRSPLTSAGFFSARPPPSVASSEIRTTWADPPRLRGTDSALSARFLAWGPQVSADPSIRWTRHAIVYSCCTGFETPQPRPQGLAWRC